MFVKSTVLASLAVLAVAAAVQAQFTPGGGGTYTPQPIMPTPPIPPRPVTPAPGPQPGYSWETPAAPAPTAQPYVQAGPQPYVPTYDPDASIRVVQPAYYDPNRYIETPQGLIPRLTDAQIGELTSSVA